MTFEELWTEIERRHMLPPMAVRQLPMVLTADVKRKLARTTPEEVVRILQDVIEEIERGSVQAVSVLVREHL